VVFHEWSILVISYFIAIDVCTKWKIAIVIQRYCTLIIYKLQNIGFNNCHS